MVWVNILKRKKLDEIKRTRKKPYDNCSVSSVLSKESNRTHTYTCRANTHETKSRNINRFVSVFYGFIHSQYINLLNISVCTHWVVVLIAFRLILMCLLLFHSVARMFSPSYAVRLFACMCVADRRISYMEAHTVKKKIEINAFWAKPFKVFVRSHSFLVHMNYLKRSLIQTATRKILDESREWMLHMLLFDGVRTYSFGSGGSRYCSLLNETFIFNMMCCIFGGVPRFIRNQLLLLHVAYSTYGRFAKLFRSFIFVFALLDW